MFKDVRGPTEHARHLLMGVSLNELRLKDALTQITILPTATKENAVGGNVQIKPPRYRKTMVNNPILLLLLL